MAFAAYQGYSAACNALYTANEGISGVSGCPWCELAYGTLAIDSCGSIIRTGRGKMIRVLIVDDEQHARAGIRNLLDSEGDVEIVGECGDGLQALERIEVLQPDALFLDIQMPGLSGIDLLKDAALTRRPYTVFTTAHEDYALKAFEVQAIDYLL